MNDIDCFVAIRAAGERTEAACARLAADEVGDGLVGVVREVPFAAAVRRGFELGVEAGRTWTLCLDADVLLRPGAVATLVEAADAAWAREPDLFEIEGRVADKILGQLRPAGVHLYRTSLLGTALREASFDARKRRPESYVKRQMAELGFRTEQIDAVAGLHDFEQYHRDIFRKVFTHTRKHERFMRYAARYWKRCAARDEDLRVALLSFRLSMAINETTDFRGVDVADRVSIDLRSFASNLDAILVPAGLAEKAPLDGDALGSSYVEDVLAAFVEPPEFLLERPVAAASRRGVAWKLGAEIRTYGLLGTLRSHAGRGAVAVGRRLGVEEG